MCLVELHISNFVVIEDQTITFGAGLNVLSGETGSGKSVVLQALELILGARPRTDYVRAGAESWKIEAIFDLSKLSRQTVQELPEIAQSAELVLSRTMGANGKGRVHINGHAGTVSLLEEIGGKIMNICGQHQHVKLLEPRYHIEYVDNFAGNESLLARYTTAFAQWREKEKLLLTLEQQREFGATKRSELTALVHELEGIELRQGLRGELEAEVLRAANAEKLFDGAHKISSALQGDQGICAVIGRLRITLDSLLRLDPELSELGQRFASVQTELIELERDLRGYFKSLDINAEQLNSMRERLAVIARLERKYRTNEAGLTELLGRSRAELVALSGLDEPDLLRKEVEALFESVRELAHKLSIGRRKAAKDICRMVMAELAEVGMKGVHLEFEMECVPCSTTGQDRAQFVIATNPGEKPKALKDVASGGELSRIMLVLKKILRDRAGVNVLVFDEIDSGVSGAVARAVGMKLKELAQDSQVICITHLPQIASLATRHFLVGKVVGQSAISIVKELSDTEKIEEIARMLAGYKVTQASRESARELLSSKV